MPFSTPHEPSGMVDYHLKIPSASSIYPRLTPKETLSALIDANNSRPAHKRFPAEILLLINEELHPVNPVYEEVGSTWSVLAEDSRLGGGLLDELLLATKTKTFYIPQEPSEETSDSSQGRCKRRLSDSISSADLLYRLRCLFPEVDVYPVDGYKVIWMATLEHNPSGSLFQFLEHKGGGMVFLSMNWGDDDDDDTEDGAPITPQTKEDVKTALIADAIRLLNTFFGTTDGRRFMYYHPAADADYPTADERYLAVPNARLLERVDEDRRPYRYWDPVAISNAIDLSSFKSLLPRIKYNIQSREVDLVNGTEDLTNIISSSLLFYRLLCHYFRHSDSPSSNVNDTPPITSVWQVILEHRRDDVFILFMDNRGLFDIRAEGDTDMVIDAVIPLVNALLSDECCHPYDGVVAGTIA